MSSFDPDYNDDNVVDRVNRINRVNAEKASKVFLDHCSGSLCDKERALLVASIKHARDTDLPN